MSWLTTWFMIDYCLCGLWIDIVSRWRFRKCPFVCGDVNSSMVCCIRITIVTYAGNLITKHLKYQLSAIIKLLDAEKPRFYDHEKFRKILGSGNRSGLFCKVFRNIFRRLRICFPLSSEMVSQVCLIILDFFEIYFYFSSLNGTSLNTSTVIN